VPLRDEVRPQCRCPRLEDDRRCRLLAVQVRCGPGRQEDGEVRQQPDEAHGFEGTQLSRESKNTRESDIRFKTIDKTIK